MKDSVFDSLLHPVLVTDSDGRLEYANPAAQETFGLHRREVTARCFPEDFRFDPPVDGATLRAAATDGPTGYREVVFRTSRKNGLVQFTMQAIEDEKNPRFLIFFIEKSLELELQKKYRSKVREKEELTDDLLTQKADLLLARDMLDRKVQQMSFLLQFSTETRFVLDEETIVGCFLRQIVDERQFERGIFFPLSADKGRFQSAVTVAFDERAWSLRRFRPLAANPYLDSRLPAVSIFGGSLGTIEEYPEPALLRNPPVNLAVLMLKSSTQTLGVVHLLNFMQTPDIDQDTVELLEALVDPLVTTMEKTRLYHSSITDELTKLHNVRYFHSRFSVEMSEASRRKKSIAIAMIDIDFFKRFNDEHGHQTGDRVLQAVADAVRSSVGPQDIVARYGGEEIIVLLDNVDSAAAQSAAEKIREAVESLVVDSPEGSLSVTISVGVAVFPIHANNPEALISKADEALYKAKKTGRNRTIMA